MAGEMSASYEQLKAENLALRIALEKAKNLPVVCAKCHLPWDNDEQHEKCWSVEIKKDER
jgi:hypothetical protein